MTKEYNIIADVAGQHKTLLALLDKMPKAATPVSVGDMVDRGPDSKLVLEFFKENGLAIFGNHEHLMLDACTKGEYYAPGVWFWNGGGETIESFYPESKTGAISRTDCMQKMSRDFPDLLSWIESLPLYLELDGAFISHAMKNPSLSLEKCCDIGKTMHKHTDNTIIWNRGSPKKMKDLYQISGHNSQWGLKRFTDRSGEEFAICLDTSRERILTGMHWPSREIFQQEFIEE
jgi:hypothetical protein